MKGSLSGAGAKSNDHHWQQQKQEKDRRREGEGNEKGHRVVNKELLGIRSRPINRHCGHIEMQFLDFELHTFGVFLWSIICLNMQAVDVNIKI